MKVDKLGCVYEIRCVVSNKVYYGQTIDFKRRVWEHLHMLRNNNHANHYMQADYNSFGEDSFQFSIVSDNLYRKDRLKLETKYINEAGGIESSDVYNYQDNITENKEMRNLVSIGQQGKVISQSSIEKMRKTLTGRKLSEEHKLHIREHCVKFKGDNNPAKRADVRKKISEKVSGSGNGMYGKHHTPEAREKIRQSRLGKPPANAGTHLSDDVKKRISNSLKGRKPWNAGKCKYSTEFISQLRSEYKQLGTYRAVQKLHTEICYDVVVALIKFGKTST